MTSVYFNYLFVKDPIFKYSHVLGYRGWDFNGRISGGTIQPILFLMRAVIGNHTELIKWWYYKIFKSNACLSLSSHFVNLKLPQSVAKLGLLY